MGKKDTIRGNTFIHMKSIFHSDDIYNQNQRRCIRKIIMHSVPVKRTKKNEIDNMRPIETHID